jgi:hypothetical protein
VIYARQLRSDVIRPAIRAIELWSESAENLLMGTAAQESQMGTYVRQLGGGPALGIFQMEPATHDDIWKNYLRYQPYLRELLMMHFVPATTEPKASDLISNLGYAAAMCRVHYRRVLEKLPAADDVAGMARYWKKYFNTPKGKGTEEEFLKNYRNYVGAA